MEKAHEEQGQEEMEVEVEGDYKTARGCWLAR